MGMVTYWAMIAAGDHDLMRPLFRMYREALPLFRKLLGDEHLGVAATARASFALYNDTADVEALVSALEAVIEVMRP